MKLITNARIHTMNPSQADATSLAIEDGRLLAVGNGELTRQYPQAEVEDLLGRIVLPGLTDAHFHLQLFVEGLEKIDCELPHKDEVLEKVAARVKTARLGEWILGHGWNQNSWDGQWPNAAELDAIAPLNPVYLTAKSLHAGWANSSALRRARIKKGIRNPGEGVIMRDSRGNPTGILLEKAMTLVERAIPQTHPEDLADLVLQAMPRLWGVGLTGIHNFDRETSFRALQILNRKGLLRLRVLQSIPREDLEITAGLGLRSGMGDDMLRIGPVKLFADGALGPHTAAMLEPYIGEPDNRGLLLLGAKDIFDLGCTAARAGLGLAVHAIGDRANRATLDAFSRLRQYEKEHRLPALRHRIEHVQVLHPADARRLAELDVTASMQPVHVLSDMEMADRCWGERSHLAYAWRTQLQAGATLAFGSDAPVESHNPFLGLQAAVTRRRPTGFPAPDGWHPTERLTIREALEAFTRGPAVAAGMEDRLGMLAVGCLADLVVLETDPFACDAAALGGIQPFATMVAGEWVWRAGTSS